MATCATKHGLINKTATVAIKTGNNMEDTTIPVAANEALDSTSTVSAADAATLMAEDLTVKPQTPVTEPNETPVESGETAEEPIIDYKAKYEEEQTKLKKAEFTLYKKNKAAKAKVQEPVEEEDVEVEDDYDTAQDVDVKTLVQQEVDARMGAMHEDVYESTLTQLTNNPDERKLIDFIYNNRITKSGVTRSAIQKDLADAQLLANAQKYRKTASEMGEALKAQRAKGGTSTGTNLDKPQPVQDLSRLFSKADYDFMKKKGWSDAKIKEIASQMKRQ